MKIGDYVRTIQGYIAKIESIEDGIYMCDKTIGYVYEPFASFNEANKEIVIKSSPNIIDLIEVGDYVNGEKVCYLKGQVPESDINCKEDVLYTEYIDEYGEWYGYEEDEIETIVTKEQFSEMEYKIGEL